MRTHPPRVTAAVLAWLAGLLVAVPVAAADLEIQGCNEMLAGEVGVREAVGNVGEFVEVPITVHTTGTVQAFVLELQVPSGLLSYVRTDVGNLTSGFVACDGAYFPSTHTLRIAGFSTAPIPSGASGRLAVAVFQVVAPGSGTFTTGAFADDLTGYVSCEDVHGSTRIPQVEWGKVKALYRDR